MRHYLRLFLIISMVLSLTMPLSLPAISATPTEDVKAETRATTLESTYTLMSGVSESSLTVDGSHKAYMLQIAPGAKASLKASFSNYFTEGSTKASRSQAASSLGFSTMTTTAQAAAYETATGRNVLFTMNGNFFDSETQRIRGYLVVEGNEIHEPDSDCVCYFAVLKDGSYDIRSYTEPHDDVAEAVAGRQWLVRNGVQASQNKTQLSARTAIGIKADGTVVCFVVDGKTNSTGVTINDMCAIMYEMGCVEAINLDGGGSSTFATRRSSGALQIRNHPSDSSGERPVISTLMLVTDPESDKLFFDFTNNSAAVSRYKADIYGGLNYDNGSWHYHHTYNTVPVFDPVLGTMSFSTTADCPTTRTAHPVITSSNSSYTSGHPLSYVPTGEDYIKIRMKIEGSEDTAGNFRLLYASDDGTSSSNSAFSCGIPTGAINNGYFVLEGYGNFGGVDTVAAIRPEVYNLSVSNPKTKPVTFTFDYIYVGPKEGAETGSSLYFDFSNSTEARQRYDSIAYGFLNFDSPASPFWATAYNGSATALTVDNENSLLRVQVTDGSSGSVANGNLIYGPWVKATNSYGNFTGKSTYAYFPLSYEPSQTEIVQLRLKTENCQVPTGTTPRAVLEYYYIDGDAHGFKNDIRQNFAAESGYQTLTMTVPSTFKAVEEIKCFGFRFQNILSHTGGSISIDYIYIGSGCYAPEPQHSYIDGQCACGQTQEKEPIQETAWKMGHTLNLAGDISVSYAIGKSHLADFDMNTVYMVSESDVYEDNIKTGTKTVTLRPVEQGDYYYFTLTGLTAVNMNDRIRSVLYGTKDGQVYYSATDDYSISDYAYSQMGKSSSPESLRILCADLLRYGAKAQTYKSYRTDNLADAAMTDAQKAYLSDMDAVTFENNNTVLEDLENAPVAWMGKSLDLASKVAMKFIFNPATYSADAEKLTLHLTYAGIDGEIKRATVQGAELYNTEYGFYSFTFDGLLAAELRTVVSAQIYSGDTPVSCTLLYSADTYGNNKTGALGELCKALFAYSDSAKSYFLS